jgi:phosphoribosyl 1,2-cyclic phosphate phosphodiesterase
LKLTILGSGTSNGVPVIGCDCPVCNSADSKDKRLRASLYIEGKAGERAVIDTGPDFRLQALRAGITRLDAVFLTHAHADHVHGLDDIRSLSWEKPVPVYGNAPTMAEFRERFSYIFRETQRGGGKPQIEAITVDAPVRLGGLVFTPIPVKHGELDIVGWKITETAKAWDGSAASVTGGTTAICETADETARGPDETTAGTAAVSAAGTAHALYLTDCTYIDVDSFALIAKGGPPDIAVIGALRKRPHSTHFTFEQAIDAALRMEAGQLYLTHICHDYTHGEIEAYCRDYARERGITMPIGPAWDEQELRC